MHLRSRWQTIQHLTLPQGCRLARTDQMRRATHSGARHQVTQRVAAGWHALERYAKTLANLLEQARQRLAAVALVLLASSGGLSEKVTLPSGPTMR